MIIRPATAEDIAAIQAINAQVVEETTISFATKAKSRRSFADAMKAERLFVAVGAAESVLGYASFFEFRSGEGYGHVAEFSIALEAQAQGQGLGRALVARVETAAAAQGIEILVGGVSSSNAQGLAFHTALGFQAVGLMPGVGRKFGQSLDLHLFQKALLRPVH